MSGYSARKGWLKRGLTSDVVSTGLTMHKYIQVCFEQVTFLDVLVLQ